MRGHGLVALFGPFPADVGFAHQLDLVGIHAEEPGREAAGRLVVVLVLLRRIGQRGRRANADDFIGLLASQCPDAADQAGDFGPGRTRIGVGFIEHQILQRGVGKQAHVGQPGGENLQLPEVGEQDARFPGANVLFRAAFLGRGQGTNGPIFGLGLFSALLASGQVGLPGRSGKPLHGHIAFLIRRCPHP